MVANDLRRPEAMSVFVTVLYYVCMYVCMCMYVCVCVYIYISQSVSSCMRSTKIEGFYFHFLQMTYQRIQINSSLLRMCISYGMYIYCESVRIQ